MFADQTFRFFWMRCVCEDLGMLRLVKGSLGPFVIDFESEMQHGD